jgi:hypothetical protein
MNRVSVEGPAAAISLNSAGQLRDGYPTLPWSLSEVLLPCQPAALPCSSSLPNTLSLGFVNTCGRTFRIMRRYLRRLRKCQECPCNAVPSVPAKLKGAVIHRRRPEGRRLPRANRTLRGAWRLLCHSPRRRAAFRTFAQCVAPIPQHEPTPARRERQTSDSGSNSGRRTFASWA